MVTLMLPKPPGPILESGMIASGPASPMSPRVGPVTIPPAAKCGMVCRAPIAAPPMPPTMPPTALPTELAADRILLRLPEPWVPVAAAPAMEMCGSEPRLCSAQPFFSSQDASTP